MTDEDKKWIIENFTEGTQFIPAHIISRNEHYNLKEYIYTVPKDPVIYFNEDGNVTIVRSILSDDWDELASEYGWYGRIKHRGVMATIITPGGSIELNNIRKWLYDKQ